MREHLGKMLEALAPGETFILTYEIFDDLFPPGYPDQNAMKGLSLFVETYRCGVDNRPAQRIIVLTQQQTKST